MELNWHAARRGNWLLGCGIVLVLVIALVIGGGIFVAMNARGWAASGMEKLTTTLIEKAPISEEERSETLAVVDGFMQRFRDGDVTVEQLVQVMEKITESPVLPAGIAMGMGQLYFADAELTEEEKADGRVQLARVAHGMADRTLNEQDLQRAVQPIKANATETQVIQVQLPNKTTIRLKNPDVVTPDELRAFIESAKATADEKGVAPEPPPFDLSGELAKAIDTVLLAGPAADLPDGTPAAADADDADDVERTEPTEP